MKGRIITFAETTPAFVAGAKTVTRREWKPNYAKTFYAGETLQAWDKNPRTRQGHRIGTIRLTHAPDLEWSEAIPAEDYAREGFTYLEERGLTLFGGKTPREVWDAWHADPLFLWVVRFEVVAVFDEALEMHRLEVTP